MVTLSQSELYSYDEKTFIQPTGQNVPIVGDVESIGQNVPIVGEVESMGHNVPLVGKVEQVRSLFCQTKLLYA